MSSSLSGSTTSRPFRIAARVGAGVFGGYAFAWGVAAAGTSLLYAAGMGFHDAEFLATLVAVLASLMALLWAVAARRAWVPWTVLTGSGALLAGVASAVQATQA